MADQEDVRRICLALPGVTESETHFAFSVRNGGRDRGVAWAWNERVTPGKRKIPNPEVLAIRTADLHEKEALLASDPVRFFTEPHYNGYAAILVRLPRIEPGELAELLEDAWRCQAPRTMVRELDAHRATQPEDPH